MYSFRMLILTAAMVPLLTLVAVADNCQVEPLLHQRRDTATIDRLERMWTLAYVRGDTDLERCILASDFTEIMRNGDVKFLQDELRFAENNKGKRLETPDSPKGTVVLHGSVAVAYGTSTSKSADGTMRQVRYADYYVWEGRSWHAFFAQQTDVSKDKL
jgi:hypothetical protein